MRRRRMEKPRSETYLLFHHGTDDGDKEILALIEASLDFLSKISLRQFDIVFRDTFLVHEIEEAVVDVHLFF